MKGRAQVYVFAYGSLMEPGSLRSTLPSTDIETLVPATLLGHARRWNVAFPNDGSQGDKAYYDEDGRRPPVVLFLNLVKLPAPRPEDAVDGLLVPVDGAALARLRRREGRYRDVDVSASVELHPESSVRFKAGRDKALAFVGRGEFTREEEVRRGVIARSYVDTLLRGMEYWDKRYPGFEAGFRSSARLPSEAEPALPHDDYVLARARSLRLDLDGVGPRSRG